MGNQIIRILHPNNCWIGHKTMISIAYMPISKKELIPIIQVKMGSTIFILLYGDFGNVSIIFSAGASS